MHINTFAVGLGGVRISGMFTYRCRQLASYFKNYSLLKDDLESYVKNKYRIMLACENEAEIKSMMESLRQDGFQTVSLGEDASVSDLVPGVVYLCREPLESGYELFVPKFAALTLFGTDSVKFAPRRKKKPQKVPGPGRRFCLMRIWRLAIMSFMSIMVSVSISAFKILL